MDVLSVLTTLIAAVGATAGVLVAVDQVTRQARTRKKAAFLRETLEAETETDTAQRDVLVSIYRTTLAKFVAQDATTGLGSMVASLFTAGGLLLASWGGWALGSTIVPATSTALDPGVLGPLATLGVIAFVPLEIGVGQLILAARWQAELERKFLAGHVPLERPSGSHKQATLIAAPISIGLSLCTLATAWLSTAKSTDVGWYWPTWVAFAAPSALVLGVGWELMREFVTLDHAMRWHHPVEFDQESSDKD